jgi:hypothetical protein
VPSGSVFDVTPSAAQSFDVTPPVQDWFSPSSSHYGFIPKGSIEGPDSADAGCCLSQIWDITLRVNYTLV